MNPLDSARYAAFKRGIGWRISNPESTSFHEASVRYVHDMRDVAADVADMHAGAREREDLGAAPREPEAAGLCAMLGIVAMPMPVKVLAADLSEYHFTMPLDGIERRMHARSYDEAIALVAPRERSHPLPTAQ